MLDDWCRATRPQAAGASQCHIDPCRILEADPALAGVLPELRATIGRARYQRPIGTLVRCRVERELRALYSEVMAAAVRLTPKNLGYKMSDDSDIPQPAEVDGFIAKLIVESEKDEDAVRTAFIGVFNFSMLYGMETSDGNTPGSELAKTVDLVKSNLTALQNAMQVRLK